MALIDGDRLNDNLHRELCADLTCYNCSMRTESGGCRVEEWIDKAPTLEDDIGKTCYKVYVTAERPRFPNTYWDYFCDTVQCLDYWRKQIMYGSNAVLYVRARPFTKSDRIKLGRTVFWTKEEADEAIGLGVIYGGQIPVDGSRGR